MKTELKQDIASHLLLANGDSTIVTCIRLFVDKISDKSDRDIYTLISDIKDLTNTNALLMLDILGEKSYQYFKNFQLPTDFAPVESEGCE